MGLSGRVGLGNTLNIGAIGWQHHHHGGENRVGGKQNTRFQGLNAKRITPYGITDS